MENLGDGRTRFVHANVRDYLMAKGMLRYIPAESWDAFLNFPDGRVRTKRVEDAGWLAAMDSQMPLCHHQSLIARDALPFNTANAQSQAKSNFSKMPMVMAGERSKHIEELCLSPQVQHTFQPPYPRIEPARDRDQPILAQSRRLWPAVADVLRRRRPRRRDRQ